LQGTLAGLALWFAGIPSALFWGTMMALLSMVPNIGSALIWGPACIYLFLQGQTLAALIQREINGDVTRIDWDNARSRLG